ncbi:hypothetical protein J3R30DRAFT_3700600 [Lentinula aciculospora]|uniref:Uncharacterized protein n=1 Tax=Lentinula aciculospora TaxID=153920 RepID=A0A9W9AES3_9AGAR|nr:hypothetical protein J3R30DRAFT_3700600 [Lentinula aciculospora]
MYVQPIVLWHPAKSWIVLVRIAAINQLLQSDESISATFPKTLNLFLFAEKCRSMSFTTCPDIYSSQHSWQLLNSQPSDQDKYVSSAQIYSTSLPSVEQMHSPSPESPSPNWLTLRNSFGLNLLLPPNFKVVSDQSTRAAAERELSLCAKLLFDLNMQASMQLSQLQNSVNANQSMTENAPSVVSQTFSVDIQSLSPTNTERPSNDSSLGPPVPVISDTASRSPSRKTLAEIKSLNHLVSSPSLQFHDHSRQSSIDLALVSSELLEPDVVQNHADLSLRPLFRISSAESNVPLNLVGEATTLKLNKAKLSPVEVEDLFGCVASSSSEASQEGDDHLLVTGDFPAANTDEMIQPCPAGDTVGTIFLDSSLNEKMSTAAPNIDTGNAAVLGANLVEVNTPVKQTRKRQPSAGGKERSRKGRNSNVIVVDTETVPPESEDALPRYGGDHLRRSKRQRTITAQKQGLDSLGLAVPGEAGMSPRRRTVSKLDKENTR